MNINIGDLVIFKYEQKNPGAKVGLVLKKEMRAMPRYAGYQSERHGREMPLDPLMEEAMSVYCLWTGTASKTHSMWWVPVLNLTLAAGGEQKNA